MLVYRNCWRVDYRYSCNTNTVFVTLNATKQAPTPRLRALARTRRRIYHLWQTCWDHYVGTLEQSAPFLSIGICFNLRPIERHVLLMAHDEYATVLLLLFLHQKAPRIKQFPGPLGSSSNYYYFCSFYCMKFVYKLENVPQKFNI